MLNSNWSDSQIESIQNIHYLLKLEYFQDLQIQQKQKLQDLQQDECFLNFADINVWFFNKDCQESIIEAKYCWDKLQPNMMGKINLDHLLRKYSEEIYDKHTKYSEIINKLRKLNPTIQRLEKLITQLETINIINQNKELSHKSLLSKINKQNLQFQISDIKSEVVSNDPVLIINDSPELHRDISNSLPVSNDYKIDKQPSEGQIEPKIKNNSATLCKDDKKSLRFDSIEFDVEFVISQIDGIKPVQKDINFLGYSIEIGHENIQKETDKFQVIGTKISFFGEKITLKLDQKYGTLFIKLYMNFQKEDNHSKQLIAQRSIDPCVAWKEQKLAKKLQNISNSVENEEYQLKNLQSEDPQFFNLEMEINIYNSKITRTGQEQQNQIWFYNLIKQRKEFLLSQHQKLFKNCCLYKSKLKVMMRPFTQISFNEDQLYFQSPKKKNSKNKQSCGACNIF